MKRIVLAMFLGLSTLFTGATQATAGGWALIELVEPLPAITAQQPVTFDVLVLQHGVTPVTGGDVSLSATNRETVRSITATAQEVPASAGVYRFEVTFPVGGTWKWHISIDQFPGLTAFPPLTVTGSAATPQAALPVGEQQATISISDVGFSPAEVVIQAGTEVAWTNDGMVPHQIVSGNINFDDSPLLQPGETYRFTFGIPGAYDYFCGPHPQMQGSIRVVQVRS
jgi:plastocyanin